MQVQVQNQVFEASGILNAAPNPPPNPSGLTINDASSVGDVLLEWTQPGTPDNEEVWVSINGGAYTLLATVGGGTLIYHDNTGMNSGDLWLYKVRAVKNGLFSSFSTPAGISNDYTATPTGAFSIPDLIVSLGDLTLHESGTVTSYSFPRLRTASGDVLMDTCTSLVSIDLPVLKTLSGLFEADDCPVLTTISAPQLLSVGSVVVTNDTLLTSINFSSLVSAASSIFLDSNPVLATLSISALQTVGGDFSAGGSAVSHFNLPNLQTVAGVFDIELDASLATLTITALQSVGNSLFFSSCPALTAFNAPALTTIGGNNSTISGHNCTTLATVSIPVLVFPASGVVVDFQNCAMSAASVNLILHRGVVSGGTNGEYDLDGGTSAAPTGQGILDKAALIAAINTVNTN